jgi:ATP-dependent DNA helicase HFM1/MER3
LRPCTGAPDSRQVATIIQVVLGNVPTSDFAAQQSSDVPPLPMQITLIWKELPRITKGLVEVAIEKKDGLTCRSALEMLRCVSARAWENDPAVLKQLHGIGEKLCATLASKGVRSIADMAKQPAHRIENILNRNPPFGTKLRDQARSIPVFTLALKVVKEDISTAGVRVSVDVSIAVQTDPKPVFPNKTSATVLVLTSDNAFIDFRRIPLQTLLYATKTYRVSVILVKPSQKICAYVSCDRWGTPIIATGLSL